MEHIASLLKKVTPELTEKIYTRYLILREIGYYQPIGRRKLSDKLKISVRPLRAEIKVLEEQGLVEINKWGMNLTPEGKKIIDEIQEFIVNLKGLQRISDNIKKMYGFREVIIVPGDSDENPLVKKQMGKTAARYLKQIIQDGDIIAITGGTTMAEVVGVMEPAPPSWNVMVVPGRGALGEKVDIQADTIAAKLAEKLGGQYKLLHVPDTLDKSTMQSVLNDKKICSVINKIKSSNILLNGIGTAEEMARRRGLTRDELAVLKKRKAVSETLGYYFDREGRIVYETSSIGLNLFDVKNMKIVITVAGGRSKSEAIISASKFFNDVLITDEGAALNIIQIARRDCVEQENH